MLPSVAPLPDARQGQSLKAFQQALGRGAGRRPPRVPGIHPRERHPLGGQPLADHARYQRQHPQAHRQQADQAGDLVRITLTFTDDAIRRIADFATIVNERTENIGARRLHTVMEKLLDEISFEGPDLTDKRVQIDDAYVQKMLAEIVKNEDLSRYIL